MNNVVDILSEEELLHLALHAAQNNAPDQAIQHVKRLLASHPDHAQARYLLGAFHAEIGLYSQAIEDMSQALALAPDMAIARFQLGLLQWTLGNADQAETTWADLDALGEREPLALFKRGLLHLTRDEFGECTRLLEAGIQLNTRNDDLNRDMMKVLDRLAAITPRDIPGEAGDPPQPEGQRMLLSAYESQPGGGA